MSHSKLNKVKSSIKNESEIVSRLSSNMIGYDGTYFPHTFSSLTNRQVANLRENFVSNTSTDIRLSKRQLSKMIKSGGFLGKLLGPLLKTGLLLIKNVIKPLIKSVLVPLRLNATAPARDAGIHQEILGSGRHSSSAVHNCPSPYPSHNNKILIMSNDEMEGIIKIFKSLECLRLLLKGVIETIQNETKD